ncbi:hypothetical protein COO60DRAFT_1460844 [Scenedesmus sp. NREL 46B-D3]|nr:hypothetical protein COO60DRAFT_1460844 [Scenedesmus sp. NREL 46B-D3]
MDGVHWQRRHLYLEAGGSMWLVPRCYGQYGQLPHIWLLLEVRMQWVKAVPIVPTNINEWFEAHPLKTKLYMMGLLCSPRWALLWAWMFDETLGSICCSYTLQSTRPVCWTVLSSSSSKDSPFSKLVRLLLKLEGPSWSWWAWLLCPGLQTAHIVLAFEQQMLPIVAYVWGMVVAAAASPAAIACTGVELFALFKCLQALCSQDRRAVVNSLLCCYLLPFIMTLQSLAVLLLLGMCLPYWVVNLCALAFCQWRPRVMISLMTTAWQPGQQREGGGNRGMGAVDAMAALVGAGDAGGHRLQEAVHWPRPLMIPEPVGESCSVPHYFICPITHSIMLEPAVTSSGTTSEGSAIMQWLKTHKRDPITSRHPRPRQVSPNLALYRAIHERTESCKQMLEK